MNRRGYLKRVLLFGAAGVSSLSIFKWVDFTSAIDPKDLLGKQDLLAELVELIIPQTDTPGGKAAMVHLYIINVMLQCNNGKQQHKFLSGLNDLEHHATSEFGKPFLDCSFAEKTSVLQYFESNSEYSYPILNKINNKFLGQPFFTKLKNLTVEGFCMSQLGATQALAYDYIPVTFEACIPYNRNQKSWATK